MLLPRNFMFYFLGIITVSLSRRRRRDIRFYIYALFDYSQISLKTMKLLLKCILAHVRVCNCTHLLLCILPFHTFVYTLCTSVHLYTSYFMYTLTT